MKLSDYKQATLVPNGLAEMITETFPSIKEKHQPGDQIYSYSNIWDLSGTFGYLLVRNGEVIVQQTTGVC